MIALHADECLPVINTVQSVLDPLLEYWKLSITGL